MKRFVYFLSVVLIFMIGLCMPVYADESSAQGAAVYDYSEMIGAMPDEIRKLLPNDLENCEDEQSIAKQFNGEYLASLCTDLLKKGITAGLKLFASLFGLIIISAVLSRCSELLTNNKSPIFSYALFLIAALELYGTVYSLFEQTQAYIAQINQYMTGIGASISGIFLLSANVSTAAVQSVWFGLLLTFIEKISYGLLFPLLQISFAITLVSSICTDINIRSVTAYIRQICTTLLVASMTLITIFMSFQTNIASAADSLGMRSVKFAASNAIPLIGGLVSESVKTLATSLSLVKNTAGFIGVAGLIVCALLPLSVLFTCKYALSLSATVADLLESPSIKPIIEESEKLVGFLIAIVLVFSIFYLFTLSLLIHTANALT